ncbi:hypothetical protein JAAARDRAFT_29622 [Jaapia argillacea MUCL 33604]|uniref:T6SS Phospholipase effector Tle1-like catalytic domain-containing protein n=1 Tax=Jaapia argillacea MUCL 33604 TaxID=933084 RepID=A0A067QBQ7_9AGAM|nr:hypothetical protein JAAARDRAFT_29622 [Jaapia argillacea MUCL 33604]
MSGRLPHRPAKRLIVCCDGTWQDGMTMNKTWKYTNILRLARTINHEDDRFNPPIPQIVFYQSGIGSEQNFWSEYVDGATGAGLGDKVQEAYAFIAHNYHPGDEIYLFGFSRGAYTARMIADLIGEIGVMDRRDLDHFAEIFVACQERGKTNDPAKIAQLDATLAPWTSPLSPGRVNAGADSGVFTVKCVGVFDTVGSFGLPGELTLKSQKIRNVFGFKDTFLGEHVERAYHALALNETRKDFNCAKFYQTPNGRRKGQVLKQCWFAGSHADIGGGWEAHDLADLTLTWMVSNVGDMLSIDYKYLFTLPDPYKPWGNLPPHNPLSGIYTVAETIQRTIPTSTDDVTHETIHPSVLQQDSINATLQDNITNNPALVVPLAPLEEELRTRWPYRPGRKIPDESTHNVPKISGQSSAPQAASNNRPHSTPFEAVWERVQHHIAEKF